jgi:hypothetical protein
MAAAALPLAQLGLEELPKLQETTKRIRDELAHSFGLTEDEDHEGWWLVAALLAETYLIYLRPPVKAAWHIEQQLVGVLDQAYNFLGGVGNAVDAGVKSLEGAAATVEHDLDPFDW